MVLRSITCLVGRLQNGNHIVENNPSLKELMSPQAIEERYKRFRGIVQYVIPNPKSADDSWRIAQDNAI